MAVNTKAIKRRMRSVGNTKKITKAMELVSAAKMRRAVEAALSTRPYAVMARDILARLSQADKQGVPLLAKRPVQRLLVVLITSNRGLCGSFNTNVFKKALVLIKEKESYAGGSPDEIKLEVIGIGKKSAWFAKKFNLPLVGVFDNLGDRPSFEDVLPIIRLATQSFLEQKYDKVLVVYTDYRSSLTQVPRLRQLLPVSAIEIEAMLTDLGKDGKVSAAGVAGDDELEQYLFEPDQAFILTNILPRLSEVQLYQAVLESAASEHSARMVSMKSATEAASDMLSELRLSFNKARQAAITQEISEIVGGAVALG